MPFLTSNQLDFEFAFELEFKLVPVSIYAH